MARTGADWWCLCSHCAPMDTEVESAAENFKDVDFSWTKSESDEDTDVRVVEHPSFALHMDSGVLDTYFRIPKSARTNGHLTVK